MDGAWRLFPVLGILVVACPYAAAGTITRGPYLQNVRWDGITIAWEGTGFSGPVVAYGLQTVEEDTSAPQCEGVHCAVVLQGLQPDAMYLYEVRDGGGVLAEAATFRTAPHWPRPFRFVVFGDTRSDQASHSMVVEAILADEFELVFNTGDMVSDGEVEEQWDLFFGIEEDLLRSKPYYPAMGNHEEDDGEIPIPERLFHTPSLESGSGQMSYYSFDYANVHFTVLDDFVHVNPWYLCLLQGKVYDNCFTAEQLAWIEDDLAKASQDPTIDHVFVLVHEGPYSSKEGRTGSAAMRDLLPLFAESKVRIIFSGHDHLYEHGISGNGIHYVVSGGGGAPLYDSEPTVINQLFPHELLLVSEVHNFQVVEVAGPWVSMTAFDVDANEVLDTLELGTPPGCVEPADCGTVPGGTCEGAWECIAWECLWVCAPPPPCAAPTDCPAAPADACLGHWECTPEGTCLWVCDPDPECVDDTGCADRPPLTDCPGGMFQCSSNVCEWVCPPPGEDVVAGPDVAADTVPDVAASPDEGSGPSPDAPAADTTADPGPVPQVHPGGDRASRGCGATPVAPDGRWLLLALAGLVVLRRSSRSVTPAPRRSP
ncbi:MAG: metallophosphoesterase [Deltaproteobacteria bacterium]|nr:metallophosphoesterase [Deltaproteobacteria bacterium]